MNKVAETTTELPSVTFNQLVDMVPLSPQMTFLPRHVYISRRDEITLGPAIIVPFNVSHKIIDEKTGLDDWDTKKKWVLMTICSAPQMYGDHEGSLEPIDIEQTTRWIAQNKQALLDFYNGRIDVGQFLDRMEKLQTLEGEYALPEYDKAYDWTNRLVPKETGLPRVIYIRPEGDGCHRVFIGEYRDAPANPRELVSMSVEEDPQVIGYCHALTEEEISLTRSWILKNLDLLRQHWTWSISDFEFLDLCQKI